MGLSFTVFDLLAPCPCMVLCFAPVVTAYASILSGAVAGPVSAYWTDSTAVSCGVTLLQ